MITDCCTITDVLTSMAEMREEGPNRVSQRVSTEIYLQRECLKRVSKESVVCKESVQSHCPKR